MDQLIFLLTQPIKPTADQLNQYELSNCCVFCDYIFLDTDERRRFAQVSHEYLIEQVQFSNALKGPSVTDTATAAVEGTDQSELRFNHPVKELVWMMDQTTGTTTTREAVEEALLQLNGHDRFRTRAGSYFTTVQRYEHHSGGVTANIDRVKNIHMYSFALKPEEHQPSGTCNFSRIDNAVLSYKVATPGTTTSTYSHTLRVYAVNYNVLRIMSGMGGLAYSN